MRSIRLVLATALILSPMACKQDGSSTEGAAAGEGSDSAEVVGDEASTIALVIEGSEASSKALDAPSDTSIALYMSAHVGAQLQPPGCLTVNVSGATVSYVFNNCTGPRGLVHLTGTLIVVYSIDAAGIHAHATANDFSVNQSTISIDSTATYSVTASGKTLTVSTRGSGTGPLGNSFTRSGDYTASWTPTCLTLNGSWSTTTSLWSRSTQVTNFTRCLGACPANGGSISHTFRTGATLTITYDGSDVAHWSLSSGLSGTINLPCSRA